MPFTCPHNNLECNPGGQTCIHPIQCDYLVQEQQNQKATAKHPPSRQRQETKPTTSSARGFMATLISRIAAKNDKH
jgi:hypothetical protein